MAATTPLAPEPLPCPFCGELPDIHGPSWIEKEYRFQHSCPVVGLILGQWNSNYVGAIEPWNTRAKLEVQP